ncbi:MAG: hypothetical protein SGJ13_15400 [Actinomycetota bacterium]|nr:hypothetical protein [Actinomycetota bacterium]
MDLNHMHLGVDDIPTAVRFYEKLGFREDGWHGDALFLRTDGYQIEIYWEQ